METPVVVVFVTSLTSVGIAIWSLATAHIARAKVLEVEEIAKRSEQIRVKATEAIEKVMESLVNYTIHLETAIVNIQLTGKLSENDIPNVMAPASESMKMMRQCVLKNAMYLRTKIVESVCSLASDTDLSPNRLESRLNKARQLHTDIVTLFQEQLYLMPTTPRQGILPPA
jgi:hypothetical protein